MADIKCLAKRHRDESVAWLFPLGIAVLGHSPKSVTSSIISAQGAWPKRIIYVLYAVEEIYRERMREDWEGRDKEEETFNNVCILVWERAERLQVCEGEKGKRPRERDCVYVRETFLWPSALQSPIWLRNEEGWSDGGWGEREETANENGEGWRGKRDTEMEGWDLAISVEYLTFIQMITPSLVF